MHWPIPLEHDPTQTLVRAMKFSSHLAGACRALKMLATTTPDREITSELSDWYRRPVEFLYRSYEAPHQGTWSLGIDTLLGHVPSKLPVTATSVARFRTWAAEFRWRDRHDFIAQVDRAFAELTIYRDDHCPCEDSSDCDGRELWFDEDSKTLVALCTSVIADCYSLEGVSVSVGRIRPALRAELVRAGILGDGFV